MENRVLSIECGRSLVRVLEVSCGGRETKIYNSFLFSTPNNMFEQNDSEEFASVLQAEEKEDNHQEGSLCHQFKPYGYQRGYHSCCKGEQDR